MGCVSLSYGGHYQLPCKGTCSHFKGLLWSMGIAMQPHIWNTKVKRALTIDSKTCVPSLCIHLPEVVSHTRKRYQLYGPQRKQGDVVLEPGGWGER